MAPDSLPPPDGLPAPPPPGALRLATAVSVASRIEPELVRAVRLQVLPDLDVGDEADLWFSDWVTSRSPGEIVLLPEVSAWLRDRLGTWVAGSEVGDPVRGLWDVVAHVHADLSPALRLEEHVTWLAVTGDSAGAAEALRPALRALVAEDRAGVATWFAAAWQRLPAAARATNTAWQLAHVVAGRTGVPLTVDLVPDGAGIADLASIVDELPDTRLAVRRTRDRLEVGDLQGPDGAFAVVVPQSDPVVLQVAQAGDWETLSVPRGSLLTLPITADRLRLRTARGLVYELVPPEATPEPARGGAVDLVLQAIGLTRALALAGALEELQEVGLVPGRLAGVSGGAVVAALAAADVPAGQLGEALYSVVGGSAYRKARPGGPSHDAALLADSLGAVLADHGVRTFGDLRLEDADQVVAHRLHVYATDRLSGRLLSLPRDAAELGLDPDAVPVVDAVLASCATPLVLPERPLTGRRTARLVDGALLGEFPGRAFHPPDGRPPARPCLGVRTTGDTPSAAGTADPTAAVVERLLAARENGQVRRPDVVTSTVLVRLDGVPILQPAPDLDAALHVVALGRAATRGFLEEWDFAEWRREWFPRAGARS